MTFESQASCSESTFEVEPWLRVSIFSCDVEEKSPFRVGCHVEIVAWLGLSFLLRFFSLFVRREKKSKSKFWNDGFFLDLVDFQSTGSWDFSSLFLTRGP